METEFWKEAWSKRQIAFHNANVHPMLSGQLSTLGLDTGARLFVPLCGKSLDIHWLLKQGFRVCGIELVETAVQELFKELDLTPEVTQKGKLKLYSADRIDIYTGDFFDLSVIELKKIDAVYDRAALVALPEKMRKKYADHLIALSGAAPQLLITFEYNQADMDGPPFSVSRPILNKLYGEAYEIERLIGREYDGLPKINSVVLETAWKLS